MDFLQQIGFNNSLLLGTALLNLLMASVVLLKKGSKNKMYLYFVLLALCNFIWCLTLLFAIIVNQANLAEFWYRSCYIAAMGIAVALLYFSVYFPFKSKQISNTQHFLIFIPFITLFFFIYSKWHITNFIKVNNGQEMMVSYFKPVYIFYSLFFIILVVSAIKILYDKFKTSEGVIRYQIIILLMTILIGLIFGSYFDLFLIYFQDFTYVWLGPIFTFPMNAAVFYLIFFEKAN